MTEQSATVPRGTAYRIQQLGPPRNSDDEIVRTHRTGVQLNEPVTGFDSLVSHHPGDNRAVRMENGVSVDGKPGRVHGYVDGNLEEIEIPRQDRRGSFATTGFVQPRCCSRRTSSCPIPGMTLRAVPDAAWTSPPPSMGSWVHVVTMKDLWTFSTGLAAM